MNRIHKLIFNSDIQILVFQCRGLCKKPLRDTIGPADPVSNLHHINYAIQENESAKERKLRNCREELQTWNELFWTTHNLSFIQKKKEFTEKELQNKGENKSLSADDVSVFYKDFLDKNWKVHLNYLCEWYKRHAYVTFLHFQVEIEKFFKNCLNKKSLK